MKKLLIVFVLIAATAAAGFAAEDVDVYEYLYNASVSNSSQLDILQNMAQARLSGAGEFYAKALRKLVAEYRGIRNVTEKAAANDQAMILSALLGEEKYTDAAPDIWLVAEGFTDAPLVRAEALMALGRIRATNYLPQVIRVLESLNSSPPSDRLYGERVAFGAIISLEKYQDPSGYLPVFFASTGWYPERIKSQALKSLPLIADDPVPYMMQVIAGSSYNYATKLSALRNIESAKIDNSEKVGVAVAALDAGWKSSTNDTHQRMILADMRKLAIRMIGTYKTDDESIYPLLERSYSFGADSTEKLTAVKALALQKTDAGAERLSKFLMDLNAKRLSGNIQREDEQMVREVIPAIGQAGRSSGITALNSVAASGWGQAVRTLADDAKKQLQ